MSRIHAPHVEERFKELAGRHYHMTLGINRTYVSSVERCERNVSIDNIEKIARALGTEVWKLKPGSFGRITGPICLLPV
jgi:transcriptional regulator with XRE-family HTH domain